MIRRYSHAWCKNMPRKISVWVKRWTVDENAPRLGCSEWNYDGILQNDGHAKVNPGLRKTIAKILKQVRPEWATTAGSSAQSSSRTRLQLVLVFARPVTKGGEAPCKPFRPPLERSAGRSWKLLDIVWKIWAPLRKLFAIPGVSSWLRAWFSRMAGKGWTICRCCECGVWFCLSLGKHRLGESKGRCRTAYGPGRSGEYSLCKSRRLCTWSDRTGQSLSCSHRTPQEWKCQASAAKSDVKQGCVLTPTFFRISSAALHHTFYDDEKNVITDGISCAPAQLADCLTVRDYVPKQKIRHNLIRQFFAGDAACVSHSETGLQSIINSFARCLCGLSSGYKHQNLL